MTGQVSGGQVCGIQAVDKRHGRRVNTRSSLQQSAAEKNILNHLAKLKVGELHPTSINCLLDVLSLMIMQVF